MDRFPKSPVTAERLQDILENVRAVRVLFREQPVPSTQCGSKEISTVIDSGLVGRKDFFIEVPRGEKML